MDTDRLKELLHNYKQNAISEEELLRELAEIEQTNVSPQRRSFLDKLKDYFAVSEK